MQINLWVVSLIDVATAQVLLQEIHADIEAAELKIVSDWEKGCIFKGIQIEWDTNTIVEDGKRVWDHKEHVIDV